MRHLIHAYRTTGQLGNAYLLRSEPEHGIKLLESFIFGDNGPVRAEGAECIVERYETLGIDESRSLRARQALTGSVRRLFVVAAERITIEAQNALLKVFEEPSRGVHFFVVVDTGAVLADTFLSRFQHISNEFKKGEAGEDRFCSVSVSERLKRVHKIVRSKDRTAARAVLDEVEAVCRTHLREQAYRTVLRDVLEARQYMAGTAPSLKMLLEHLAYSVPQRRD